MTKEELELKKLNLEIKKLKRPLLLRPEFLGLIIPFLTIIIAYFLNKPEIEQALKQREWEIDKNNWEIKIANQELKEEKKKLNSERDLLIEQKQQIGLQIDSLKTQYNKTVDSLNNEITKVNDKRVETLKKLASKESELQLKPIKDAIAYIKSKNYSSYRAKEFFYLIDTKENHPNRALHIKIIKDALKNTNSSIHQLRLSLFLLNGEQDQSLITKIEDLIYSNPEKIDEDVIRIIDEYTRYFSYDYPFEKELSTLRFNVFELALEMHRKGKNILKYKSNYSILAPRPYNFKPENSQPISVTKDHKILIPFYAIYFKDIENYFEAIRISLNMINNPKEFSDEKNYGIDMLAYFNRLIYLTKIQHLIITNDLSSDETASILRFLPDEDHRAFYGPGWEKFEHFDIPKSVDKSLWNTWKNNNQELININSEQHIDALFEKIKTYWVKNKKPINDLFQ